MKIKNFLFSVFFITTALSAEEPLKKADFIFFGGDILTLNDLAPHPETLVVADGKILFIGEKKQALFLQSEKTQWVNLQGGALLPGFIASDANILLNGLTKFTLDLSSSKYKSFTHVLEAIKEAAKNGPVLAMGYNPILLSKKGKLNFKTLDAISLKNPIVIIDKSGTIAYGNKKSFQLAGISETPISPINSYYQRSKNGSFTGVVFSSAAICSLIKPFEGLLQLDFKTIIHRSLKNYAKKGYTTVTESYFGMDFPSSSQHVKLIEQFNQLNKPFIRIQAYGLFPIFEKILELKKKNSSYFHILGISLCLDGSLQNYQAALTEKYKNKNTYGTLFLSQQELDSFVIKARQNDLMVSMKASGDQAIAQALKACEKAQEAHYTQDKAFVIQQASLSSPLFLKIMNQVHASPSFCVEDISLWGDVLKEKILGSVRVNSIDLAKTAGNLNVKYSFNQGGALGVIDPLLAIQTTITRETRQNQILNQDQRLMVEEALKAFTLYPAYQTNRQNELGSLEIGKFADFVILNKSPKKVPTNKISTIKVLETWIEGTKITWP